MWKSQHMHMMYLQNNSCAVIKQNTMSYTWFTIRLVLSKSKRCSQRYIVYNELPWPELVAIFLRMKTKYCNLSMLEYILNNDVIIIYFLQASSLNMILAIFKWCNYFLCKQNKTLGTQTDDLSHVNILVYKTLSRIKCLKQ
jgi:hypothetical protein